MWQASFSLTLFLGTVAQRHTLPSSECTKYINPLTLFCRASRGLTFDPPPRRVQKQVLLFDADLCRSIIPNNICVVRWRRLLCAKMYIYTFFARAIPIEREKEKTGWQCEIAFLAAADVFNKSGAQQLALCARQTFIVSWVQTSSAPPSLWHVHSSGTPECVLAHRRYWRECKHCVCEWSFFHPRFSRSAHEQSVFEIFIRALD